MMELKRVRMGKPRIFKNEQEYLDKYYDYLDDCELKERCANIAGFCWFSGISRSTFHEQSKSFPAVYELITESLENEAVNYDRTQMGIFILKNKFGYRDKIETENVNTNTNMQIDVSKLTDEQLNDILKNG